MTATIPYRYLSVERDGTVAAITMVNAAKRNALALATMRELIAALTAVGDDTALQVVVLRAEGPVFSAGHDLRELRGGDVDAYREIFDVCTLLMTRIQAIPQPVIAEVAGIATAAGCQVVATCDLAIAADNATFATPGVKIGLFCSTPMVALTRAIGRKRAMEMLLTGEFIDAATAAEWGLINRVVPGVALHDETMALARKIASSSPYVVGIGKEAFYKQIDVDQETAYAQTREVMVRNALARDAQEGISAFLERRAPTWSADRSEGS